MKNKGLVNAILRLHGARKFGSSTLLAQAEAEAQHALKQAKVWLERSSESGTGEENENYQEMLRAVKELEELLAKAPVE
jgi:HPt (histidine-containing phosphotransfer) domain-containing protein